MVGFRLLGVLSFFPLFLSFLSVLRHPPPTHPIEHTHNQKAPASTAGGSFSTRPTATSPSTRPTPTSASGRWETARETCRAIDFFVCPYFLYPEDTHPPTFFPPHIGAESRGGGCSSAIRVESTDRSIDGGVVCCGVLCLDCRREKKRTNGMSLCVLGKGRADCVRPHEIDWCVRCDVSG